MATISPIPFDDFREELLDLYRPPMRQPKTFDRMKQVVDLFAMLRPETTAGLTVKRCHHYINGRRAVVRVNTIIGELGYLRAACNYACSCDYLDRNPFDYGRLKMRRERLLAKSHHSIDEVARVLRDLERLSCLGWKQHRLFALAAVVAYTGIRRSEALYLQPCDVHLDHGILTILGRTKNLKTDASAAPVPIADELANILQRWLPEAGPSWLFPNNTRRGPWLTGKLGDKAIDQLKAVGKLNGVDGLTFHSLRHSWATHAETRWGMSREEIKRVLRHTNPFTSVLYCHADLPNLRRIGLKVSYLDPTG